MNTPGGAGPAFPQKEPLNCDHHGMSLRDYFAAKAMQGDWSSQGDDNGVGIFSPEIPNATLDRSARLYYRMAEAMLRARKP